MDAAVVVIGVVAWMGLLGLLFQAPASTPVVRMPTAEVVAALRSVGLSRSEDGRFVSPHGGLAVVPLAKDRYRLLHDLAPRAPRDLMLRAWIRDGGPALAVVGVPLPDGATVDPVLAEALFRLLLHPKATVEARQRLVLETFATPTELARLVPLMSRAVDEMWRTRLLAAGGALERIGMGLEAVRRDGVRVEVDGVWLTVQWPRYAGGAWQTTVTGDLRTRLPHGTLLRSREGVAGPSETLGDLFLDRSLHIQGMRLDVLRERLAQDAVRGPLLELLCRWQGSKLTARTVVHTVRERVPDPASAIDRVVELVRLVG